MELVVDLRTLDIFKSNERKIVGNNILVYSADKLVEKVIEEDFDFIYDNDIAFPENDYLKVINIPNDKAKEFEEWLKMRCMELYFRFMRKREETKLNKEIK